MKIASIDNQNCQKFAPIKNSKNPNFKSSLGLNLLSMSGALMQGIENKGYVVSFLIQDGLGMTLPRTATGFYRDREITGEYNIKEGIEVFGREGMTGPFLMSVAPFMLWLSGKYCKSAGTNTRLIKIIGKNFKSLLEDSKFNQALQNDKQAFKKEFIRTNIQKFYEYTLPEDKKSEKLINYIVDEFENLNSKDKHKAEEGYKNILNRLNEQMVRVSPELENICRLSAEYNGKKQTFASGDVIKAINNFANDAIENNPEFKNIDINSVDNIKNNFAAKRLCFNIATIIATLGGLSVLPKIYAYNSVPPGAQHLIQQDNSSQKSDTNSKDVSFKGKGINSQGFLSKLGNYITKKVPDWIHKEFEYNGYNFTMSLMACLSLFGLLLPRGLRAYDRALVDENGKKDMTEINEILLRDTISSLGVVYTVPIMQKGIISTYENSKGYILSNRASMNKSWYKKVIDAINPYSSLKLLSNTELQALYGNIDSRKKMINFAKFIDAKGGDIEKILSQSETQKEVFNDKTFTLESIRNKTKEEKNKKIISFFENLKDDLATKDLVVKLMNDNGLGKKSSITKMARGLSSIPGFLSTVMISPILLGWFIPRLTYANTRKKHEKMNITSENNSRLSA